MKTLLLVGVVLVGVSYDTIATMWGEHRLRRDLAARYSLELPRSGEALASEIGTHVVSLHDDLGVTANYTDRSIGTVRLLIDGRDYSSPAPVTIRTSQTDANRYWGYVLLRRLVDRQHMVERLVVSQNLGGGTYRTVAVDRAGEVTVDTFSYSERCAVPVRALLINYVTPHPVGICSDIMTGWPGLWFPLVYPLGTTAAGLLSIGLGTVIGMWRLLRRARQQTADESPYT